MAIDFTGRRHDRWDFGVRGRVPRRPPVSLPERAAALRPALTAGLSAIPLDATLMQALALEVSKRGPLDPAIADAVASVPALQTIRDAYVMAQELETTRADIAIASAGANAAGGVSNTQAALQGAAQGAGIGATVGGPVGAGIGAGLGAAAHLLSNRGAKKAKGKTKAQIRQAEEAISPGGVQGTLAGLAPAEREQVLGSGQGTDIGQELQAAISRSGLRDSALGSLAGLAAAAAPEQAARARALSHGLATTRQRVETILRSPIRAGQDRLTQALGAAAEGFLLYRTLLPRGGEKAPSGAPVTDPFLRSLMSPTGGFTPAEEPLFTPAGG